ncbi:MAG: beta-galactosidase [Acidobacteria bacterium]|nr:beta-galactosidase [Acidobacteriota bacterium]
MCTKSWTARVFATGEAPENLAASFAAVNDPSHGPTLLVGPWLAGLHSARYEYKTRLTTTSGQLRGWYKTDRLLPYSAAVFVTFAGGGKSSKSVFNLAPAGEWTEFAVPIRRAPPETEAVIIGVGLTQHTEGQIAFAGLAVSTHDLPAAYPEDPGAVTRPAPEGPLTGGDFYRIQRSGDAWWLVSPDGRPMYSTGTDGPSFRGAAAGGEMDDRMRALKFNSLAGWTALESWADLNQRIAANGGSPLATFRSLQTGTMDGSYDRLTEGGHAFPDPFDPRWETTLRAAVRTAARPVKGKQWFVGFFADNEADHRDLYRHVYTPNCAGRLRAFLEKRYGDITALNLAWGTAYASFQDLIDGRPEPALRQGPMYEDLRLFKREIVRRYVETLVRVIREEAPGHLVFSNRFMLDDLGEWMDVIDLYQPFDAIGVNVYPANLGAGLDASERLALELVHRKTGRPVIVTEWSIPALDSGLYSNPNTLDWSYPQAVDTQTDRARQAARVTLDLFNLPFVIGAHWFIWSDFDSQRRQANRGLFRADGTPWVALQTAIVTANERIEKAMEGVAR